MMPNLSENRVVHEQPEHEDEQLKGSLVSSLILGGLIVVCWLAAFLFHLSQS